MENNGDRKNARPGRPRDDQVDNRIRVATLELYGKMGWHLLSIQSIAQHAGVAKSSIYLRWQSKEEVLLSALSLSIPLIALEEGDAASRTKQLITNLLERLDEPLGSALLRLMAEFDLPDVIANYRNEAVSKAFNATLEVADQAKAEGIYPANLPSSLLGECLYGAILARRRENQVYRLLSAPQTEEMDFADQMVRLLFRVG